MGERQNPQIAQCRTPFQALLLLHPDRGGPVAGDERNRLGVGLFAEIGVQSVETFPQRSLLPQPAECPVDQKLAYAVGAHQGAD